MLITREFLLNLARETTESLVSEDHSILAIYLCGSTVRKQYQLGGTADVDLFVIHTYSQPAEREIRPLTGEVHLDIAHHLQDAYRDTRNLRLEPWLGSTLAQCTVLYDPQHFMDFTQASVRGQFERAERVLERARRCYEEARRQNQKCQLEHAGVEPGDILEYLRAVEEAANAIACLNGPPLTERRLLLNFPERAQAVGRPGLNAGLLGLLGAPNLGTEPPAVALSGWLPDWRAAYCSLPPENAPARLHRGREIYYYNAFEAMLAGEQPQAVLWPMLRTWTGAVRLLSADSPERAAWNKAVKQLGLLGDGFKERVQALDAYLDLVIETLDNWGQSRGVWSP